MNTPTPEALQKAAALLHEALELIDPQQRFTPSEMAEYHNPDHPANREWIAQEYGVAREGEPTKAEDVIRSVKELNELAGYTLPTCKCGGPCKNTPWFGMLPPPCSTVSYTVELRNRNHHHRQAKDLKHVSSSYTVSTDEAAPQWTTLAYDPTEANLTPGQLARKRRIQRANP